MIQSRTKRIPSLDLLKIIATVIIVLHHIQQVFEFKFDSFNFFYGKIYFGYLVELFFMISGFFAARKIHQYTSFKSYIVHKSIRVLPMAWVSTLTATALLLLDRYVAGDVTASVGIWRFLTSILMINPLLNINIYGINNPLWYLSVLLVLYCLIWLIYRCHKRYGIGIIYLYVISVVLYLAFTNFEISIPLLNSKIERGAVPFFIGCIINELDSDSFFKNNSKKIKDSCVIVLLLCAIAYCIDYETYFDNLQMILIFLFYPALIILNVESIFLKRLLDNNLISELGKISFEMYVWHVPVFYSIKFISHMLHFNIAQSRLVMLVMLAIVVFVAGIMYYCVEKPLTRRLAARLENRWCSLEGN